MATKTRHKGEGSIRQRPDGRWEFRIKGKSYYFKTDREAIREGRKIAQRAETCDLSRDKMLFSVLASRWMEGKKKTTKASTWQTYEYAKNRLVDELGKKKVVSLKKSDFQGVLDDMAKKYSSKYIDKVREVANGIMELAYEDETIARNPVKKCTIPANAKKASEREPFTTEEVELLKEQLPSIVNGDIPYLLLETGMRSQELCALDKDCLEYIDGVCYLHVHQAMSRDYGKWVISETKTESGKRKIPIGKAAETLIKKRIVASPSDYLFVNRQGKIINYNTLRSIYKRAIVKVEGVRYLSPHCCRHTFATKLYREKVDILTAQKLLGHADYQTTANLYTHIKEQDLARVMSAVIGI